MKCTTVEYILRKKCGPFTIVRDRYRNNHWGIVQGDDSICWYPTFCGNSKQRRQQRRKMIRDLNKDC